MAAPFGATRQAATDFFFTAISHYMYAGDTALHMAAAAFSRPMAELLVSHGANGRVKNRRGAEPLHYASDSNRSEPRAQADVIEYLISIGADPSAVDKSGGGALAPSGPNAVAAGGSRAAGWRRETATTEQVGLDTVASCCPDDWAGRKRFGRGTPATGRDHQALAATWRQAD